MSASWKDPRPMSPHLQIWRWHPAMLSSILHRASAIISYVALFLVAIGVLSIALTGRLPLEGLIYSPLGAVGLFVFLFAFIFMAFAQIRHNIWDRGHMFTAELNNMLSYGMILLALVIAGYLTGSMAAWVQNAAAGG